MFFSFCSTLRLMGRRSSWNRCLSNSCDTARYDAVQLSGNFLTYNSFNDACNPKKALPSSMFLADMKKLLGNDLLSGISSMRYSYSFHKNYHYRNIWSLQIADEYTIEHANKIRRALSKVTLSGCKPRIDIVSEDEIDQGLVENLWSTGQNTSMIFYNIPSIVGYEYIQQMLHPFQLNNHSALSPIERLDSMHSAATYKVTFEKESDLWNAYLQLHATQHYLPNGDSFYLKLETILFICICKRDGTVVVARSFYDISKTRIEGLVGTFPKLVSKGQQHTFVESDQVRYLFKILESFGYLVIVTSKNSNVLQDTDLLNACSAQLSELCPTVVHDSQQSVSAGNAVPVYVKKKFEILFAFDELVHQGNKQTLTNSQLSRILSMESHDEIIENAIQKRKEKEAKEQTKLRIKQLEMQKKELAKHGRSDNSYLPRDMGIQRSINVSAESSKTYANETNLTSHYPDLGAGKGLKLGKTVGKKVSLDLLKEEQSQFTNRQQETKEKLQASVNQPVYSSHAAKQKEPIAISIEEFVSATISKDSQLESFDVRGSLSLSIIDQSYASVALQLAEFADDKNLQIKTHPNINKEQFTNERLLAMKDVSKPFPCNQNLGLLKWKYSSVARSEDSYLPISVNIWPTELENGEIEASIEFEGRNKEFFPIKDLLFRLPCPENVRVSAIDGEYSYNQTFGSLDWSVPVVDATSPSGCLTFTAKGIQVNEIFPIQILFKMDKSVFGFDVEAVTTAQHGMSPIDAVEKHVSCEAENFTIQ